MDKRIRAAILPAMIGLVVLSGCGSDSLAPIAGYQLPGTDDWALVLQVRIGPNDVKEARVVKETDREVEVEVPAQVDNSVGG